MAKHNQTDYFSEMLRSKGLKATSTRLVILELLDKASKPQSSASVYQQAKAIRPVDRVTVYRTMEAFYQAGLLERDRAGGRSWLYHMVAGPDHERHPHFRCSGCGSLECLPPKTVKLDMERLKDVFPAQVDHFRVSLEGVCPKCLAKGG
jgi:Fe2+ or Zn2+ uptake regulation protein